MSIVHIRRAGPGLLVLSCVLGAFLAGCSRDALPVLPNVRPTIEVTQAPIAADQPFFYGYELRWAGYDEDGFIDHYRYAVDPPSGAGAETTWFKTNENRKSFLFRGDSVSTGDDQSVEGYHTIVLQSVDDRGSRSQPVWVSLTSFTIAPTVQVVNPPPGTLFNYESGPSIRIRWTGTDPDGRGTSKPVKYKYRLFSEDDIDLAFASVLTRPDTVRKFFGPRFTSWDSVGGDTTFAEFHNMRRGKHVFTVVAIDEAGAFSPVMSQQGNMLYFLVFYNGLRGPALTVYNESFFFEFEKGGFRDSVGDYIRTEAPAGRPLRFNWYGKPEPGTFVSGYRWMLDGNISDETSRTDESKEFRRWSRWSPLTMGVDLPAFNPAGPSELHNLYIEAVDNNNQISLVVVQFTVVRVDFDKELLIVDDTRLLTDKVIPGGCTDKPSGPWPTAAELDTHFFARGGKPWKCYPAGTLSNPGIFSGYDFDTLGTRFLPQGTLTLQQLARYRHIVWYTDNKRGNINPPYLTQDPMSELRWLTLPGRSNPLGTWVSMGGQIWMFGGGAASALQINAEKIDPEDVYSNEKGELVPGRFMYDVFGWRSEITARSIVQATKPDHPIDRGSSVLSYTGLPDYLFERQPETDPEAVYGPNRKGSGFYQSSHLAEGLTLPNVVTEDLDPGPGRSLVSVVDTLYESVGGNLGSRRPVMTVHYGGKLRSIQVFSGFQLWYWQRAQQIQILDWVLQSAWRIPRAPVPR